MISGTNVRIFFSRRSNGLGVERLYNFLSSTWLVCVCACVYSNFSWVHFLFICWCSHWHPFLFDSALEGDEVTANINLLRYLARLMFWREAYFGILRVSPVYIGATTGQLLLEQRYLIDIKFDSDLWYFQGWITYYKTNLVKHWF